MNRTRQSLITAGILAVLSLCFTPNALAAYANSDCLGCHTVAGQALAKVDFTAGAVDKLSKCEPCHWFGNGPHGTGQVWTPVGYFARSDSPSLPAEVIHNSHRTDVGDTCAVGCHYSPTCERCHGTVNHSGHGGVLGPSLPTGQYYDQSKGVWVVTYTYQNCADANCHDARPNVVEQPGCSSSACHTDKGTAHSYSSSKHAATGIGTDLGTSHRGWACTKCHLTDLSGEHKSKRSSSTFQKGCVVCHPTYRESFAAWDKSCIQGLCHTAAIGIGSVHKEEGRMHAPPSTGCQSCHDADISVIHQSTTAANGSVGCGVSNANGGCHVDATTAPTSADCMTCHPGQKTNHTCRKCHSASGQAAKKVDFTVGAVDKLARCEPCHWFGNGPHGTGQVWTPVGYYASSYSPSLPAEVIHNSHRTDVGDTCAVGCHYSPTCQRCHGETSHTAHGSLTEPMLPSGQYYDQARGHFVWTYSLQTCANDACHKPRPDVVTHPVCLSCHAAKKSSHYGNVAGTVKSDSGAAISGAAVSASVGGYATTTDAQGKYSFLAAPGAYTVTAAKVGYVSSSKTITASAGATVTCDFVLSGPPVNLALNKTTKASSTSGSNTSAKAVDGSTATYWAATKSAGQWIYVDLGSAQTIGKVVLKWGASYGKSYRIEVSSNAKSWTSKCSTTTGAGGTETITFPSGSFRYVRMYCVSGSTTNSLNLSEFEIYRQ